MINGITWHGKHSLVDFGATLIARDTNVPIRDRVTERVPYSSVTYDFTALFGADSYPERKLQYQFVISDEHGMPTLKQRVNAFRHWLYNSSEKSKLCDDREPKYYFYAVCTEFTEKYTNGVMAEITVTFAADPFMIPDAAPEQLAIPVSDSRYPDIDGDGSVTSEDAALILSAAANLNTGLESGLTEEQELLADADRDGRITANDAALIRTFAAQCGAGIWDNSPKGWVDFLNQQTGRLSEAI
ncbi:MAG: hypothetical protein K2H89_02085 [Oscillospiraceae bacterium]|nr:hypothetical protein [Oscillospiraceae bacterium]